MRAFFLIYIAALNVQKHDPLFIVVGAFVAIGFLFTGLNFLIETRRKPS